MAYLLTDSGSAEVQVRQSQCTLRTPMQCRHNRRAARPAGVGRTAPGNGSGCQPRPKGNRMAAGPLYPAFCSRVTFFPINAPGGLAMNAPVHVDPIADAYSLPL